jgi:hypothetical protein
LSDLNKRGGGTYRPPDADADPAETASEEIAESLATESGVPCGDSPAEEAAGASSGYSRIAYVIDLDDLAPEPPEPEIIPYDQPDTDTETPRTHEASPPVADAPVWERRSASGTYTIDRVWETPSNSEENAVEMFLVNRRSPGPPRAVHEVRYYRTRALAEAAALQHERSGTGTADGEILVA